MRKLSIEKLVFLCLITTIVVTAMSLSKFATTTTGSNSSKVAIYAIGSYAEDNKDLKISVVSVNYVSNYGIVELNIENKSNELIFITLDKLFFSNSSFNSTISSGLINALNCLL